MTVNQIVESILQSFPQAQPKQILLDIDTAQKNFALESGLLRKKGLLSSISTNTAWLLPNDFNSLIDVLIYDGNGVSTTLEERNLAYEIELGKFFIYSLTSTTITGVPAAIATIYLDYAYKPSTISGLTDTLTIDEEFHEGIEAKVLSKYFAKFPINSVDGNGQVVSYYNVAMAKYWSDVAQSYINKAKRKIAMQNVRSQSNHGAMQYQYAGKFTLPRRTDDTAYSSTVNVSSLSEAYSKYARFNATDPTTVTEAITPIGYTITSESYSGGNELTINAPSGTFSLTALQIESSDPEFVKTTHTTSQIVLTWAASGSRVVEIFER